MTDLNLGTVDVCRARNALFGVLLRCQCWRLFVASSVPASFVSLLGAFSNDVNLNCSSAGRAFADEVARAWPWLPCEMDVADLHEKLTAGRGPSKLAFPTLNVFPEVLGLT